MARQSDLAELHKRTVRLLATFGEGLNESQAHRAEADRAAIADRLDAMESAVNRMEGALRIEFEPVLRSALREVIDGTPRSRRRLRSLILGLGLLAVGTALGANLDGVLRERVTAAASGLQDWIAASPNGGSGTAGDSLE